jgi:cobalt-zinc-cadmium efflux system outer membrane protein
MLTVIALTSVAQNDQKADLTYSVYMNAVMDGNKEYAARKLNIDIAEASVIASKVFNNPEIGIDYTYNDDRRLKMGQSVSAQLSKDFTVGKRGANIRLAESERQTEAALIEDFFHTLRAESAAAYLTALKQISIYDIKKRAYLQMREIATADSLKYALGETGETEMLQSRMEMEVSYNALLSAEADLDNACAQLQTQMGNEHPLSLPRPAGQLQFIARNFNQSELIQTAIDNRADLEAKLKEVDVARNTLNVRRKERNTDFNLSLGYEYNAEARNEIAPAPKYSAWTVGIAVPLKFSNTNKGAVNAAQAKVRQAELYYEQAKLEVRNSVAQSLRIYNTCASQLERYQNGLLQEAEKVLAGKLLSYEKRQTSLLELISARRAYDDVQTAYIETLTNTIASLIQLERNAGIWDIEL